MTDSRRPFRFSVTVPTTTSRSAWRDTARRAEDLGFSVLVTADHLAGCLPPLPPLVAAAEATTALRVGTLVVNNDLHHPVVLAREAAAVDLLTDGRLELGLGAGHAEPEYVQAGIRFDPAATRVERLAEAVAVIRGLLDGEELEFEGRHYRVRGHRLSPGPVQRPVPILVGGNGRSLLRLAARAADIVGMTGTGRTNPDGQTHQPTGFPAEVVGERVALVREAAGDRFDQLELNALVQGVIVTGDRRAAAERVRRRLPELSIEQILTTPYLLIGTVDQMVEQLHHQRERFGFTYYSVFEPAMEAVAPLIGRLRA